MLKLTCQRGRQELRVLGSIFEGTYRVDSVVLDRKTDRIKKKKIIIFGLPLRENRTWTS